VQYRRAIPVLLSVLVLLLLPASALGWANGSSGSDSFGTHDWALKEATDLAAAQGAFWVDLDVALPKTDDPDTVFHDTYYHVYDVWGSCYGNAPKQVAYYYEAARTALLQRDTAKASEAVGVLSHYYSDICNPLHTDQVATEDRMHSKYENVVQGFTSAPEENDSWVTFDGATPAQDAAAFTVKAATEAHADYSALVGTFTRSGFDAAVRAITIRSLDRASNGPADMIISLGAGALPPTPTPTPTATPTPSPTPTPTRVLSVSGSVSDSSPAQYASVTAYCRAVDRNGAPISGVSVTFTWRYKTTSPAETRTTGSDGVAACTRGIGRATVGYTVNIGMSASWEGQYASTSTSFTPH
jgi:hypothetical protein